MNQEYDLTSSDIMEQFADVYMCWKNKDSVFLGCNQNFADLVGKSKDDIIGYPDGFSEKQVRDDQEVISSGVAKLHMKETIPGPDGKDINILTNKGPLRNKQGEIIGTIVCFVKQTDG